MTSTMTKQTDRRLFRRLRAKFKADLGLKTLTGADRVLLDQCALLALRARQMREHILTGDKVIDDDDLVRATNAAIRAMTVLHNRSKDRAAVKPAITLEEYLGDDE
jgi:hypothetical protein